MLKSPKPWHTGMLHDLSAQSVLRQELVVFASPDCLGQVIAHPGKKEKLHYLANTGRETPCLSPPKCVRH